MAISKIGITEANKKKVCLELSKLLSDEVVLASKTRKAHWYVQGKDFHSMHLFFESQYKELDVIIDDTAERIRILGHFPPASLKEFSQQTHLTESNRTKTDSQSLIEELVADHESIAMFIRGNIDKFTDEYKDAGSSDFITGVLQQHEKMLWFLSAHLDKKGK